MSERPAPSSDLRDDAAANEAFVHYSVPTSAIYDAVYEDLDDESHDGEALAGPDAAPQDGPSSVAAEEQEALSVGSMAEEAPPVADPSAAVAPERHSDHEGEGGRSPDLVEPTEIHAGDGAPSAAEDYVFVGTDLDSPAYDESTGFRIGFDDVPATSLVPARPIRQMPVPAPQQGGSPPPAAPPRAQARHALRDRAEAFYRNRRLVLGCFLGSLALALLITLLTPKRYEAYSVLLIDTARPAGAQEELVGEFIGVPGAEDTKVLNQALILQQAPVIAERTAARLLETRGAAALSFTGDLRGAPSVATVADYLQTEVVTVSPAGEEVDAIRVAAASGDAEEAALIAGIYTEEYEALTRETSRARITAARTFLEEQVARREGELNEIERQIADYTASQRAVGLDAQTQSTIGQIAALQSGLDQARIEAQMRAASLRSLEREMAALQPRMAARTASTAEGQIRELDTQINELERVVEQIYLRNPDYRGNPDAHPDLRELESRLQRLRAEKQSLARQFASEVAAAGGVDLGSTGSNGQSYLADLRRQIATERAALSGARAESGALAGRLAEASSALVTIPEQARELAQLQRGRTATEQLVLFLSQKLQEARVAEETEFGLVQTIRAPQVPLEPASPHLPFNLLVGGMLGLLLGLGTVVMRQRTNGRLYTPGDLEAHGFTVVGTATLLEEEALLESVNVEGVSVAPTLVALTQPFAPSSEAFRHLHAAVQGAGGPQIVLVTSAEVEAGKSLVAANLAAAAGQAGRRVLIVDADLRRPSVHTYFGLGSGPVLGEGVEAENLVYWNTVVPGLFALTPKEPAGSPDALWGPEPAARLLGSLRSAFDLIIVDAPPALVAADAAVLAPHCDAALLVASSGQTDADALTQVAVELAGAGLTQVGTVLNRFDPKQSIGFGRTFGYRYATRYAADRPREGSPSPEPWAAPVGDASPDA